MTYYQFKILNQNDQAQTVWQIGEHLFTRNTERSNILLWQIEDFYVEIYYDCTTKIIVEIKTLHSTEALEVYLDQIDISFLLR